MDNLLTAKMTDALVDGNVFLGPAFTLIESPKGTCPTRMAITFDAFWCSFLLSAARPRKAWADALLAGSPAFPVLATGKPRLYAP